MWVSSLKQWARVRNPPDARMTTRLWGGEYTVLRKEEGGDRKKGGTRVENTLRPFLRGKTWSITRQKLQNRN